jgi:hypothetical protein
MLTTAARRRSESTAAQATRERLQSGERIERFV